MSVAVRPHASKGHLCVDCAHRSLKLPGASLTASILLQPATRPSRERQGPLQVTARGSRQTRLATRITTIPRRIDLYFADRPLRRALWAAIAFYSGFYCANTASLSPIAGMMAAVGHHVDNYQRCAVSLSFGALAINDVVAAALTVAFCEVVSAQYYGTPRPGLKLLFANCFKVGIICALMADAFKLGG